MPDHNRRASRSPDAFALDAAARRIGDRWSLRVVGALLDGDHTFGELAEAVDGIAPTILTARLRALQRMSLVTAAPYERRPLRMRYSLTEPGRRLGGALASLAEWGADREGHGPARAPRRVRLGRRGPPVVPDVRAGGRRRDGRRPHLVLEPSTPGRCPGTWWAPPPSKRSGRAIPVRRVRFPSTSAMGVSAGSGPFRKLRLTRSFVSGRSWTFANVPGT